jgi:hypothetical protein
MRRTVCLYSPSLVLAAWAAAWAAGATTNGVMVAALLAEAVAIWLHVQEQLRRYRDGPQTAHVQRRSADRRRSYRDLWLVALSVILVWSSFIAVNAADDAKHVAVQNRRAIRQSCDLVAARIEDNIVRLSQTVDYLNDPRNVRENPGLVRTIHDVSIPFNVRQIRVDRKNFPSTCGSPPRLPAKVRPLFRR